MSVSLQNGTMMSVSLQNTTMMSVSLQNGTMMSVSLQNTTMMSVSLQNGTMMNLPGTTIYNAVSKHLSLSKNIFAFFLHRSRGWIAN